MDDKINIEVQTEEASSLRTRALVRTVEWLMGSYASIIRLHLPDGSATRPDSPDVLCGHCGNSYPCESIKIAENAFMGAREFMGELMS